MKRAAGIVAVALALIGASSAQALTLESVGTGFEDPTYVTSSPGDPGRLLVVERGGAIKALEDGIVTPFADLSSKVGCPCSGERGLMSIAFDPGFGENGQLYVDYASQLDGKIHIERLTADPGHQTADPATLEPLLEIEHPTYNTHYGGQLQFGPDGVLYASTGDGGGTNDPDHNAQDPLSLLGKILHIDTATETTSIWSYGLRNPFRFSFDRLKGDLVIGDVGQAAREEIDFAPSPAQDVVGGKGANYGWNCREGYLPGFGVPEPGCASPPPGGFDEPVFDYSHGLDPSIHCAAVIGGYVVRDPSLGALYGSYVYSDLCSGVLRSLRLPETATGRARGDCSLGLRLDSPVSFGEGGDGKLYVVEAAGTIYRLTGSPPSSCPVPLAPEPVPPLAGTQLKPTLVGIKAQRRRVERGKRALLTVYVSPCEGRKGTSIELLRNGRPNGTRYLSRACTARFLPRVRTGTTFTAVTRISREYEAGRSRHLTIRLAHRRHH